jgi:thioredoxin 1
MSHQQQQLDKKELFDAYLRQFPVVIVKFVASWCEPCKEIQPRFEALIEQYKQQGSAIATNYVDVDVNKQTAYDASICAMPTFILYHLGYAEDCLCGADAQRLEQMFEKAHSLQHTAVVISTNDTSLIDEDTRDILDDIV